MKAKRALFRVYVNKPGVEPRLIMHFSNYNAADKAIYAMRELGYKAEFEQRHGYSLYANAEDAVEAARWFN